MKRILSKIPSLSFYNKWIMCHKSISQKSKLPLHVLTEESKSYLMKGCNQFVSTSWVWNIRQQIRLQSYTLPSVTGCDWGVRVILRSENSYNAKSGKIKKHDNYTARQLRLYRVWNINGAILLELRMHYHTSHIFSANYVPQVILLLQIIYLNSVYL